MRRMGETGEIGEGKWGCQSFGSGFLCIVGASFPLGLPAWTAVFEEFVPCLDASSSAWQREAEKGEEPDGEDRSGSPP